MRRSFHDVPFSPARCPIHYGWVVLGCAVLGTLASLPGQTVGVSVFTDELMVASGLERTRLSQAYMIGTIGSAAMLTWAGFLYDRWGARVLGALAAAGLGLTLGLFSQVQRITAVLGGGPVAAFVVMCLGFFLLRFLGQGVMVMTARNMLMKWFNRRRGLANGISNVFVSFGFSVAPAVLAGLIAMRGWQGAWGAMGLVIGVGFALLVLVLYRDSPEPLGLEPDAGLPVKKTAPQAGGTQYPWTLRQALRTWAFWPFNLGLSLLSLYVTALIFHLVSIFADAGMSRAQAIAIFMPAAGISVAVSLVGGWLSDRIRIKWLLMVMLGGLSLSAVGLLSLKPGWPVWLIVAGNGLSSGLFGLIGAVTWPRFYGRRHLGAVSGHNMAWLVLASAVGPVLFSTVRDYTGSYRIGGWVCLGLAGVLAVSALRADTPATPVDPAQARAADGPEPVAANVEDEAV